MKHPSNQRLFAHWNEKRGRNALPERTAIDPAAIKAGLGDTFILAFDRARGHPLRLAGTRVCALVDGTLKGRSFMSLWRQDQQGELMRLVDVIADENIGIVAGVSGGTSDGATFDLELLLLPLRHWGRTHGRLIGAIAPLSVPSWFGTRPIAPLALGDYRYVGLRDVDPAGAGPLMRKAGRPRRGFVVYDGGKEPFVSPGITRP